MEHHLVLASRDRLALFRSHSARRRAARTVARVAGASLLWFCVVDDHLHAVVQAERQRAARLGVHLALALQPHAESRLASAHVSPVQDRAHLRTLVSYVLDQTSHHELRNAPHPALWAGSSFPDLVGARLLQGFDRTRLAEALPRLGEAELFAAVGLPVVSPATDDELSGLGVDALARHIAEALGHDALDERRPDAGRASLAVLATRFGVASARIARAIGTSDRQVRRLAATKPDPRLEAAVRRWVAIRRAARADG